jgi:soluble lytic murein transglycosylase-like protein
LIFTLMRFNINQLIFFRISAYHNGEFACLLIHFRKYKRDTILFNITGIKNKIIKTFIIAAILVIPVLSSADTYPTAYSIIKRHIIDYNLMTLEKERRDDSYRGEQGILRIRPDIAESFGMKVMLDKDYLDSKKLFGEAEEALEEVEKILTYRGKKRPSDYQARKILNNFLLYREKTDSANKKLSDHLSRLNPDEDDRFNNKICEKIIDRLLAESFTKTNKILRDGLGHFYNLCQGVSDNDYALTTENVRFVNYVFNGFIKNASASDLEKFDIDMDNSYYNNSTSDTWKGIIKQEIKDLISIIESAVDKTADNLYSVDPLLFTALMKRESSFNPLAVSGVGAAGLTQIMPKTAKNLGLKNIYMPEYLDEANTLLKKERDLRKQAHAVLMKITRKSDLHHAEKAFNLMQRSLDLGKKREKLFNKYKRELLKKKTDDRLQPANSIEYGLLYFAGLLKKQKGDISLALASYNAGPHKVKEYGGIPPFDETVGFRNYVLKYYREYLKKFKNQ